MKKTATLLFAAALIGTAGLRAQTAPPPAQAPQPAPAPAVAPVVTPEAPPPAVAPPATPSASNAPVKAAVKTKPKPKPAPKIEWADATDGYRTINGNLVKLPYIVQKDGKHLAYKRWGEWHIVKTHDDKIRAMADAKVAQEAKESAKTAVPAKSTSAPKKAAPKAAKK